MLIYLYLFEILYLSCRSWRLTLVSAGIISGMAASLRPHSLRFSCISPARIVADSPAIVRLMYQSRGINSRAPHGIS